MDRGIAVILMAATGGLIALQAPINAGLGRATGSITAAFISFAIGTLLLALIMVVAGQASGVSGALDVPWYYLVGGILGAAYVFSALVAVSAIGAGAVAAATITGQLTLSVVIDRMGILGLEQQPITALRILGVALLLAGTYLIVRY
jgi:transporter family-2 protein